MSWDKELWVVVSLIQSAPHRAAQYTASVLIIQYAFPWMHNCFCSRFHPLHLLQQRQIENHPLVNSFAHKFLSASHKQVCILHPPLITHTCNFSPPYTDTIYINLFGLEWQIISMDHIFFINTLSCYWDWLFLAWVYVSNTNRIKWKEILSLI